jgi:hypothetical protein
VLLKEAQRRLDETGNGWRSLVVVETDIGKPRVIVGPPPVRWTPLVRRLFLLSFSRSQSATRSGGWSGASPADDVPKTRADSASSLNSADHGRC